MHKKALAGFLRLLCFWAHKACAWSPSPVVPVESVRIWDLLCPSWQTSCWLSIQHNYTALLDFPFVIRPNGSNSDEKKNFWLLRNPFPMTEGGKNVSWASEHHKMYLEVAIPRATTMSKSLMPMWKFLKVQRHWRFSRCWLQNIPCSDSLPFKKNLP